MKIKVPKIYQTTTVAAGVFVLLSMVAGFLFFEIKNKNNEISTLHNQLDVEVRRDQRLRSIKQLLSELHVEVTEIDDYFVATDGVVDFLEALEALGRVSGASVEVNSVSVIESDPAIPYEHLRVEFYTEGRWSTLTQLLSLLETAPYGVIVSRSQVERVPNSSLWQAHIIFQVLKLK